MTEDKEWMIQIPLEVLKLAGIEPGMDVVIEIIDGKLVIREKEG